MPQQAEQAAPILEEHQDHGLILQGSGGQETGIEHSAQPQGDQNGDNGLQHVGEDDHKGQRPAKGAEKVGQPRVAAAVGAHVIPQDILGDDHRPVEAAAEIGDEGGQPQLAVAHNEINQRAHALPLLVALLPDGHAHGGALQAEGAADLVF